MIQLLGHIPKIDLTGGQIFNKSFCLNAATDGAFLISGSSIFHSDMQFPAYYAMVVWTIVLKPLILLQNSSWCKFYLELDKLI